MFNDFYPEFVSSRIDSVKYPPFSNTQQNTEVHIIISLV